MNTIYLFDKQKYTPEGMVSVSQIQTFLSCRKKWEYNYIENLRPRIERSYLTIGRLCHRGMQVAMQELWKDQRAGLDTTWDGGLFNTWLVKAIEVMQREYDEYCATTPHLEEEIPEFEKLWEDAKSVFRQAFEEFEPWKYEVVTLQKNGKPIPALELHFKVPCPPTKGLHGYIDAIMTDKETGFTWCVDYKFRKSLSPDEDEAFNIQNAVYAYACNKMGVNITGTMTWQHLNTPAAEPRINKDGSVSTAKIKTTWKKYAECVLKTGGDPEYYREEMVPKLADIEWYRATLEYRNEETLSRIWQQCITPVARQIKTAYGKKANNFRSLYPWNCKMCQYQSLCQAELRDYDAEQIRMNEYSVREVIKNTSALTT